MALAYTVTGKLWIGLLAGDRPDEAFMLGIQMSAVMVLMPQIVKCIMEGLLPLSERAKKILSKRFGNGEFYIGLDPAVLLGDSQVVTAGLLFIPITLLISMILPGNQVLPFGDLATISFFIAIAVAVHKGNLFRTLISGSLIMTMTLWITNQTIPWVTALAKDEIEQLFDTKITSLKEVIAYAKKIHEMGVDNVVLSLGKRRSWL